MRQPKLHKRINTRMGLHLDWDLKIGLNQLYVFGVLFRLNSKLKDGSNTHLTLVFPLMWTSEMTSTIPKKKKESKSLEKSLKFTRVFRPKVKPRRRKKILKTYTERVTNVKKIPLGGLNRSEYEGKNLALQVIKKQIKKIVRRWGKFHVALGRTWKIFV